MMCVLADLATEIQENKTNIIKKMTNSDKYGESENLTHIEHICPKY